MELRKETFWLKAGPWAQNGYLLIFFYALVGAVFMCSQGAGFLWLLVILLYTARSLWGRTQEACFEQLFPR